MRWLFPLVCLASVLSSADLALPAKDDAPKLPDRYAQVVLRVEGMI